MFTLMTLLMWVHDCVICASFVHLIFNWQSKMKKMKQCLNLIIQWICFKKQIWFHAENKFFFQLYDLIFHFFASLDNHFCYLLFLFVSKFMTCHHMLCSKCHLYLSVIQLTVSSKNIKCNLLSSALLKVC